ncbi:snoRNA-binding rRNA-processing protein utp10 [Malassezia equina]|uniref:U3 small nucleolar RNA-associated protein 10 n=1 Tax=Malassezia equina TaxID=1381935 RepID=A0AAF0EDU9_9BASI|nr:snoRNA-binding rRNA-processing protein utp10 [Malassezia equina]
MTSSLASQLAGLRSHNAARLASASAMTSRDSYLFTPRVAAEQDHGTVHALGQTGWEQLVDEDAVLAQWPHGDLLFGEQTIHTDRTTLPKASNDEIDTAVAEFLYLVGPRLLSRSVAKCLEWLVRRFRIHVYSSREVLRAFLPYHLTPQFARMLQLVPLESDPALHFLQPVQKAQTPLPTTVLLHAVSGHLDLLRWVAHARAPQGLDVRRAHVPFWTSILVQVCLHRRANKRRGAADAQAVLAILVPEISYMADARDTEAAVGALMVLCSVGAAFPLSAAAVRGLIDGAARLATSETAPDVARAVVAACIALCASPDDAHDPFRRASQGLLSASTLDALLALPELEAQWSRALTSHDVTPFSTQLLAALCAHLAQAPARTLLEKVLDDPALPASLKHRVYVHLLCMPAQDAWDARVRLLAQRRERDPDAFDRAVSAAQDVDASQAWHVVSAVLQWQASGTLSDASATDAALWLGVHSADASAQQLALQHLLQAVQQGHVRASDPLVRSALETALARASVPLLTLLRQHTGTLLQACGASALLTALRPSSDMAPDAVVPALALAIETLLPAAPELGARIGRELVWPRLLPLAGDVPCVDALPLSQPAMEPAVPWVQAVKNASEAHDVHADPVSWTLALTQSLVAQQQASADEALLHEAQFLCDALEAPISRGGALALLVLSELLAQPIPPRVWTSLAYRAVVLVHTKQLLAGQVEDVILGDSVDRAIVQQVLDKLSRSTVRLLGVQLLYTVVRHMPVGHDASLFVDVQQRRTPAAQLALLVYQTLHAPGAGAVASEKLAPVFFERLGSQAFALLAGVWTTSGGSQNAAPTSVAELAQALDTQCVVPRSDVPVRLMAMRHAAMLVRAAAAQSRALDLQTLLPSLLVVLQDTVPVLRDAAAQLLCAMDEWHASCEGARDVYGLETVYGSQSAALQYLDTPTYAKYVSLLAREAGAFLNDASYLALSHTTILRGSGKKDAQFRTKVLCYLLSHAVCTPDLDARTAWLGLVRDVPAPCKLTTVLPLVRDAVHSHGRTATPMYLAYLFATYDITTVPVLEEDTSDAWSLLLAALRQDDAHGVPRAALHALQAGLCSVLPMPLRQQVLLVLAEVVAHPPTPRVAGGAEALRTLPVSDAALVQVLRTLCEQVGPTDEPSTKRARGAAPSHEQPRHAAVVLITVLESLQSRTLGTSAALVAALFDVVRVAIELCTSHLFNAEYLLQLAMQSLCSLFDHITVLPADVAQVVRADTIVSAIQVSANTQSINHAILLLARFARLDAELVLHNIMPIFTFVGLSVLQRDDRFTLSVVEQTLRSIIPAFVNAVRPQVVNDKDARLALWRETRSLLRIFSDASPHIPRHRRHVFFRLLVDVLGTDDFLAPVCMLLADRVAHRVSKSPSHSVTLLQLPLGLVRAEPLAVRLRALNQIWAEIARLLAHADDVFLAPAPKREYSEEHLSPAHQAHTLLLFLQHAMHRMERADAEACATELGHYAWHTLCLAPTDASLVDALEKARAPAFQALPTPAFLAMELVLLRGETTLAGMPNSLPLSVSPEARQATALSLWEQHAPLTPAERHDHADSLQAWHEALIGVWEAHASEPLGAAALQALRTSIATSVAAEHADLAALMPRLLRLSPTSDGLRALSELLTQVGVRALAHLAALVPYASQAVESGADDAVLTAALQLMAALFKTLPQFMHAHVTRTMRLLCARTMQTRLSRSPVRHAHRQLQEAVVKKMPVATVLEAWAHAWKDEQVAQAALLPILHQTVRDMDRNDVLAHYKHVFRLLLPALDAQRETQEATTLHPVVGRTIPVYVALALKLSESQFRPLFLRTYDWAVIDLLDEDSEGVEARTLVLYALIERLLEQLHAMFVPFYAVVLEHALTQLRTQSCETAVWQAVARTVRLSAEADEGTFWNATRATPLIAPLTHALTGAEVGADEAREAVLALARAVPDDTYLSALNRALLALANDSVNLTGRVRALDAAAALWEAHGVALLTFVPETVATLSETLDDADPRAAAAALALRAQVEEALGEPLDSYLDTASVARGVKGLLPYVRQVAPHCLVPVQLADLAHARIAIDATLLTQRFFYRDSPDPVRYVAGFRDVIERLRDAACVPIFVFDHSQARLPQKARENARRRAAHRLATARYAHEQRRIARLERLCQHTARWEQCSGEEQARTCHLFQQARHTGRWGLSAPPSTKEPMTLSEAEHARILPLLPRTTGSDDMYEPFSHALYVAVDGPVAAALPYAVSDDGVVNDAPSVWHMEVPAPPPTASDLAHAFWRLYVDFHATQHEPVRETLSQCHATHAEAFLYDTLAQGPDAHGSFGCDAQSWHTICHALLKSAMPPIPLGTSEAWHAHAAAMHLRAYSTHLLGIYCRSSRLVPPQAYLECMELCREMQAPVFVTGDGTPEGGVVHEAEAFASALVREGFADMVASEDTDVLLYQVPMLRGLSNMALELVDPLAMRDTLFPDTLSSQRQDSLVQFALLCGTDFNRTIPGIAAKNAHRLIALYQTVAGLFQVHGTRYYPPDNLSVSAYLAELDEAARLFAHPPHVRAVAEAMHLPYSRPALKQTETAFHAAHAAIAPPAALAGPMWATSAPA